MRIMDCSSDVCSSDLDSRQEVRSGEEGGAGHEARTAEEGGAGHEEIGFRCEPGSVEEARNGQEEGSTGEEGGAEEGSTGEEGRRGEAACHGDGVRAREEGGGRGRDGPSQSGRARWRDS